jgi:hypothetical protein
VVPPPLIGGKKPEHPLKIGITMAIAAAVQRRTLLRRSIPFTPLVPVFAAARADLPSRLLQSDVPL